MEILAPIKQDHPSSEYIALNSQDYEHHSSYPNSSSHDISGGGAQHGEDFNLLARIEILDEANPQWPTSPLLHSCYRRWRTFCRWSQGPQSPRQFKIKPFQPQLQNAPLAILQRALPTRKKKLWLFIIFSFIWAYLSLAILYSSVSGCQVPGYETPIRLSCVSRFWRSSTFCGIDGSNCRPFHNATFAFRCPASCRGTIISSPETVGDVEYNYRNIVVGGSAAPGGSNLPVYRGDSFICGAAIHAGIFKDHNGGSGVVSLIGEHDNYQAVDANGISSLNFTPSFPVSFTFLEHSMGTTSLCKDPRWTLLITTMIFTVTVSMLTSSPSVFFGSTFVSIYFYVALASDPADFENYMAVVSWAFRGFLPAVFVALVLYHFCIKRSLSGLTAQVEKTVLWLGGCWLGASSNLTFERLPVQRLTLHDLQQPGALLTVIIIVLAITVIAIFQALAFRAEGRMLRYLNFYACLGLLILALMAIPRVNIRIHHYILALILIPGTALQTRPSLFYQGLLLGLFINGIARWGFDSILQTPAELFGNDFNSPIPKVAMPNIDKSSNSITFSWNNLQNGYDSMSVLVNDVERFRGSEDHDEDSFTWKRYKDNETEYFRFGYVKYGILGESSLGKFTKPGTWNTDGNWIPPEPGPGG
ncbi:hypothetical protein ACLMJK_008389 [Lecanora helva]